MTAPRPAVGAGARSGSGCSGGGSIARHRVGHGEDGVVVAPARGQGEPLGRSPGTPGEGAVEALDGAGRGTAPAVDRLPRVADGQDGVAGLAAEQRLQHAQLADAGVLVLVEQHDLPPGPLAAADLGGGDGDAGGVGHLVGVVDGARRPLARLERLDQRQQRHPGPLPGEHLQHRRVRAPSCAGRPRSRRSAPPAAPSRRAARPGLMSCSPRSAASASTSSTVVSSVSGTSLMSPVYAVTTVAACPQHIAGPSTPAPGSTPIRSPCSATSAAA